MATPRSRLASGFERRITETFRGSPGGLITPIPPLTTAGINRAVSSRDIPGPGAATVTGRGGKRGDGEGQTTRKSVGTRRVSITRTVSS